MKRTIVLIVLLVVMMLAVLVAALPRVQVACIPCQNATPVATPCQQPGQNYFDGCPTATPIESN